VDAPIAADLAPYTDGQQSPPLRCELCGDDSLEVPKRVATLGRRSTAPACAAAPGAASRGAEPRLPAAPPQP
jgi:hypothetical protein